MSGARPSYHHGDVRRAASEAVAAAIRQGGEEQVTIRSVAAAIGVTHAALYRHVRSVDELLDDAAAVFLASLVDGAPAAEPVAAFLERYAQRAVADPHHYRLAFARRRDGGPSPRTEAALRDLRDHAALVFAHAWPGDAPRDTMHRVIRTWSTVHGMLDLAAHGLVVAEPGAPLVRYVVRSGLRAAGG